jgi:hypothetical protein
MTNQSVYKEIVDYVIALSRGEFDDFDIQCYYVKNVRPLKTTYTVKDILYYPEHDLYSICSTEEFKVYLYHTLSNLFSRTYFHYNVSTENGFISFKFTLTPYIKGCS